MSDPSAVPSALGIEAVEWIAEGGENLTVRVTGRWRRRRPDWTGKPTLVVEAPGRRYRFPAMPEPPSLSGAGPGTWRITFSVPAALAPDLGGRAWLQFGSVSVPLPTAVEPLGLEDPVPAADPAASVRPALGQVEATAEPGSEDPNGPEVAGASAPPPPSGPPSTPRALIAIRRAEEAEAAVEALTGVVRDLERDLAAARTRADDLAGALSGQERDRRSAQQRAHAERELRLDLARELAGHSREAQRAREAFGQLAAAEARVRELEAQLGAARRRIDEAEQVAATATAARDRARQAADAAQRRDAEQSAELRARLAAEEEARLRMESGLRPRSGDTAERVPNEPGLPPVAPVVALAAAVEPAIAPAAGAVLADAGARLEDPTAEPGATALVSALRAELDLRAGAEASLRARVVEAEARLAARESLGRRAEDVLADLRRELEGLRGALAAERDARIVAERRRDELERALGTSRARSRDALTAISELREVLAGLTPPAPPAPTAPAAGASEPRAEVEPERLSAALARLRERTPAPESVAPAASAPIEPEAAAEPAPAAEAAAEPAPAPAADADAAEAAAEPAAAPTPAAEPTARDWLGPVFRSLVAADPDRAGRLLVGLLPAQGAVLDEPLAYDLIVGGRAEAIRVTAGDDAVRVAGGEPRPAAEVAFQVVGDHAGLARMVVAGPLRRRFGRGVARVRGRRSAVTALEALSGVRLDLAALHALGVRLDARTALTLVAVAIDPQLTARESFSLAYVVDGEEEMYLVVHAGAPLEVTGARPAGRIAVTIGGPAGTLERVLGTTAAGDPAVSGDEWPLAVLRKWIKSAQSG